MLRIAIISNYFSPWVGGIEKQNQVIGEALVQRGHEVTVLTRRYDPALPAYEVRNGVRIERFRPSGHGVIAKWLMNIRTFHHILMATPTIDAVLVTQCSAHVFGPAVAGVLRGIPIIVRPVEPGEISGEISAESLRRLPSAIRIIVKMALNTVRRWAYRHTQRLIAISARIAREAESFGVPRTSVVFILNALDVGRFRPISPNEKAALRKALGITPDTEIVTWVGRLAQRKGLLTLIDAWKHVARKRPSALLLMVGSGLGSSSPHDAEPLIRAAINTAGLQDRILLTGAVADVERYLQASDLFVFPSEPFEGFANALAEAMSCGLPVVCTRIECGSGDLVIEGEHGFKFDVGDSATLSARVEELLANEPLRKRMGLANRSKVEEILAEERVVAAYEQVFLSVSRSQPPLTSIQVQKS